MAERKADKEGNGDITRRILAVLLILAILCVFYVLFFVQPNSSPKENYISCDEAVRLVHNREITPHIVATHRGVYSIPLKNGTYVILNETEAGKSGCNFTAEISEYYNELVENCRKTNCTEPVPMGIGIE